MRKRIPADGLPDEDVTTIDEIPVYSTNKSKPESLAVLKILDSMKEGGRPKMMNKDRLIRRCRRNWQECFNRSQTQQAKGIAQFNKYSRIGQSFGRSRV